MSHQETTEYTCTKTTAVTYQLRAHSNSYGRIWADATIREWKEGGSLDIQSDMGSFAYTWSSIGPVTLREFLCKLHFDYFMEKTRGTGYLEFDPDESQKEILRDILEARREGYIDKEMAKTLWNSVHNACSWPMAEARSLEAFMDNVSFSDELVSEIYDDAPYDMPWRKKPTSDCRNFWELAWPLLCKVWREEIEQEAM